jgi:hypothetical protein
VCPCVTDDLVMEIIKHDYEIHNMDYKFAIMTYEISINVLNTEYETTKNSTKLNVFKKLLFAKKFTFELG